MNILIDEYFNGKVADFGTSRIINSIKDGDDNSFIRTNNGNKLMLIKLKYFIYKFLKRTIST